jgi:DivIVA domain-containing protein
MPLTAEDVSNKRFTPVRLREGYDMGEVDQFLDEVQLEIERLTRENDDLRAKLAAAQSGGSVVEATPPPIFVEEPPAPARIPEPVMPAVPAVPVAAAPSESIRVETVPEASNAAARLLEIATRNAEELVEAAKNDADRIVGEARAKVERIEAEAKVKADRAEAEARGRAAMLETETAERRKTMLSDLEREREKLTAEVEGLRSFEREYRSRLKNYFRQQLESLETSNDVAAMAEPAAASVTQAPKRLRSILGEEG